MLSIRIPSSLIDELKKVCKKDHYLDISETVRSIIRNKWTSQKDPLSYQIKKLRSEISQNISIKNQEQLIEELKKIRDSIIKKPKKND
jgi:Arc/MetJ-type ribon-helix-helix transcriptional regulator